MARQRAIRADDGRRGGAARAATLRAPHLLRRPTGSGKTTSALRSAGGRVLKDHSALFFVDQKGDPYAEAFLRTLAAAMDVPFILFDPRADDSDHWQPLWGQRPAEVVARVLAGIQTSEPYYADVLRLHVGIVARVLHIAGYWPPSFPLLVEASQLTRFDRVLTIAAKHTDSHPELWRRVQTHARFVASSEGHRALAGGLTRLDLVIGEAWRSVLTPRPDPTGQPVGVSLTNAITERAVVLWRTHVDLMPDEAQTITAVILTDIHASAVEAQTEGPARWTCLLDEFGAVVATAADQALALLQRGRTHEGQVLVVTQSIADMEALTGQPGLLASMADNFAGFIVHRQSAPESRDWLAKLMGTTALWQSTDQTSAHAATGAGSRRRVREFRISSDTFSELRVGEAVIHTTLGPPSTISQVQPLQLRTRSPPRRIANDERSACEIRVHPAGQLPIAVRPDDGATAPASSRVPSAGKPTRPDQHREDHGANLAHSSETAPHHRHDPAQSFDDA
ncbi:MAG: TraG/TraD/VirD4 family protein [Actinobacteria bacterium]|nr:TraG/TraD/VirD4 family protein [Actinomycetota bacterium]